MNAIIPIPRCEVSIRPAIFADIPFIDGLQKANSKMVGWMPRKQLEQKIGAGHVLIAETRNAERGMQNEEMASDASSSFCIQHSSFSVSSPLGYCIGTDRYFKRDDVGIIYQMNVVPGQRRKLVGASLVKALFERAAYGCRLYCCWCAQDIEANYFWESLGFIPLAFRTGSATRGSKGAARTHIFWQTRIREGDVTTPYWFPAKTDAGALREDRLVLPIPPGVKWSDEMPVLLPRGLGILPERSSGATLELSGAAGRRKGSGKMPKPHLSQPQAPARLWFAPAKVVVEKKATTRERVPRREKIKADPAHVAKARELRDRYLEQFNDPANAGLVLGGGKYEVARALAQFDDAHRRCNVEPQIEAKAPAAKMLAA